MSHIVPPISDRPAIHLNPQAPLAERVLVTGDPHRALAIAHALLGSPRMFNTRRGLWGYTGEAGDGLPVTVQTTGMGGPSAAIVIEELVSLGARAFVRVGTCGALRDGLALGDLVVARAAIAADGTSRALGADGELECDPELTAALVRAGARAVTAVSTDVFYDPRPAPHPAGADVVEMETAAILAVARRHGVRAACLLAVTDVLDGGRDRIPDSELEAVGVRAGEAALRALYAAD